jgi:murein DD-endopeptidase MepM/ murein hydrolase activator NlpD
MGIYSDNRADLTDSGRSTYPRKHLVLAVALGAIVGFAVALAPPSDAAAGRTIVSLGNPVIEPKPEDDTIRPPASGPLLGEPELANREPAPSEPRTFVVRKGDNLSTLFARAGLTASELDNIMAGGKAVADLKRLMPGQQFHIEKDSGGALSTLRFEMSGTDSLLVQNDGKGGFTVKKESKPLQTYTTYAQGTIQSSLMQAGKAAGLSATMTLKMAEIFAWDIDFALEVQKGDSFRLIYEELFVDGKKVKDGNILAAEFVNQGKRHTAIRFERKDAPARYLSADGSPLRKAFIRSPVDFARISSHFSFARRHPVLHTIRAHKGTDYAAGYGTPVKAVGDGTVILAGRQGGYGNVLKINHGRGYQTLYAHLQGFAKGVRNGTKVEQGQIIGYVGSSGLATGPHLHFEFYVNGQVRNPVTVALPDSLPIEGKEKATFISLSRQRMKQLATFSGAYEQDQVAVRREW